MQNHSCINVFIVKIILHLISSRLVLAKGVGMKATETKSRGEK